MRLFHLLLLAATVLGCNQQHRLAETTSDRVARPMEMRFEERGTASPLTRDPANEAAAPSAVQKMSVVFVGQPPAAAIKAKLYPAFELYDIPKTEEHYSRQDRVLITLRKVGKRATEVQMIDLAIEAHTPDAGMQLLDIFAIAPAVMEAEGN